jgi:hypothetical protein
VAEAGASLENPLGHGNFLSGLKLSGERDGGLGLARFTAVCPLGGHISTGEARDARTAELRRRPLFSDKPIAAAKSETEKTQAISGIGRGR